jgi:ornithine cyclodeaminase
MLLFSQKTGELVCILLDEGHLTDIRTAVAGAVAAKHLAPKTVERIGIVGTGIQAHMQLQYLTHIVPCRQVLVWGRGETQLANYRRDMRAYDFELETTQNISEILSSCNLIVTTTPSTKPLLQDSDLGTGVHITAVGSDTPDKQELDSAILGKADLIVADSISQCLLRGEIFKAIQSGFITEDNVVELGNIIAGKTTKRTSDSQITVADLTGVAVQDIKISTAVYQALSR